MKRKSSAARLARDGRQIKVTLGACAIASALTACSLFVDLNGLADATSCAPDCGDAAETSDGSSISDGSETNDGFVDPGSDAKTFSCPANAFCDDFERDPSNVRGSWDSLIQTGGAETLQGGQPTGTTLHVTVDDDTSAPASATVDLIKNVGAIQSKATISSRLFLSAVSASGGIHFNLLTFTHSAVANSNVFPYLTGNQLSIGELECSDVSGCHYAQGESTTVSLNAWHDISFTADFTTAPASLTIVLDGKAVIEETTQSGATKGTLEVQAAAAFVDANHTAWDLMIDNVVVSGQ